MGTSFDSVEDLGLIAVRDYKIDKLYNKYLQDQNPETLAQFYRYLDSFLVEAVPNFLRCKQSLDYSLEQREFVVDLTTLEQSILADLFVIQWWKKETNDATQINLKLQVSSNFTSHSSAQNMKEKTTNIYKLMEDLDWKITQYQLAGISSSPDFLGAW